LRAARLASLLGPPAAFALVLLAAGFLDAPATAGEMATITAAFVLFGSNVVFTPTVVGEGSALRLGTWELAAWSAFLSCAFAFFWCFNVELLERIPGLGPRVHAARANAAETVAFRPWLRRWATLGVVAFVISPLPGSGSMGGSLVARLIGLSRTRAFVAVSAASAVVSAGYAAFGSAIEAFCRAHHVSLPVRIAGAVVALVLLVLALRWLSIRHALPRRAAALAPVPQNPDTR
jgi:hypothetical protein